MFNFKRVLIIGLVASTFAACSSNKPPKPAPHPPTQEVVTVTVTTYYNSVWFEHDDTKVSDDYTSIIKLNADYLIANPTAMIQLQGNASEAGSKWHNEKLATARAKSVAQQFISLGVNPKQIQQVSFGSTKPTYPSDKKGHSPQNRRVDIVYISGAPVSYYIDQVPLVSTEDESVDFIPASIKGQKHVTHTSSAPVVASPPVMVPTASAPVTATSNQASTAVTPSDSSASNGGVTTMDALPSN